MWYEPNWTENKEMISVRYKFLEPCILYIITKSKNNIFMKKLMKNIEL